MPNKDLDFVKTITKETVFFSYWNHNDILQHLSKVEFLALQNLGRNNNISIQKSGRGNSTVIVNKIDYWNKIENLLNDVRKFQKIILKNDGIFSFVVNQEKQFDNILKKLVASDSKFEETRRSLKQLRTGSGIMHGLCKVHKGINKN